MRSPPMAESPCFHVFDKCHAFPVSMVAVFGTIPRYSECGRCDAMGKAVGIGMADALMPAFGRGMSRGA